MSRWVEGPEFKELKEHVVKCEVFGTRDGKSLDNLILEAVRVMSSQHVIY